MTNSTQDLQFERIRRNVKVKGRGEYDIVADDKGRVLVIEVKNKLDRRMVDEFMQKKLPRFKILLPEYQDRNMLAGIGALSPSFIFSTKKQAGRCFHANI